ncbi:MAG: serine hydrolase, partial [Acidobacteria bacterium]|nr:serine hydrolase [Acidobacteriota bacterium]
MRHMTVVRRVGLTLVLLGVAVAARPATSASSAALDRLQAQIVRAAAGAHGTVGVAIKHLESGTELFINGDESFPMASTFKLPVLLELYAKAKAGRISWDEIIDIGPLDQHLGSGELAPLYDPPGVHLSLHNVANLMMLISDNSAADICLAKAGVKDVNARLASLGITGIRVDRSCQELILDYGGQDTAKLKNLTLKELRDAMPHNPRSEEARFAADDRYAADPRDTATPRAFVTLLEKIWRGEAVDRASSDAILETMKRCRTGEQRIRGLLPRDTPVAHKTGTIGGVIDDVGIVYLPDNAGHIAIAV